MTPKDNKIVANNHILFSSAKEIENICNPIKRYFNVTHFNFVRTYDDRTCVYLGMNLDWNEFFYQNYY